MENKIYKLLEYCLADNLEENIGNLNYQLFAMSLRTMRPHDIEGKCVFNIERYKYELKTLRFYMNGNDVLVINRIKNDSPLTLIDENLEFKLLPIVISNSNWEYAMQEVLKCVTFYTYNRKSMLDALIISSIISDYFSENVANVDAEYFHNSAKQRIIDFSLKDFYKDVLNIDVKKSFMINFEKDRIEYLLKDNLLEIPMIKESRICNYLLNDQNSIENIKNPFSDEAYIKTFAAYLYKLRKGLINPEKLRYMCTDDTDLKISTNKSTAIHPILGKYMVEKTVGNYAVVKTKSGKIKVRI